MALVQVTAPATEPVTLEEARGHLRVDVTDEDTLISSLITAARDHAEAFTQLALVTQTWRYSLDHFPAVIRLPKPPVQSVASIKYIDDAGVQQTLAAADYRVDTDSEPARITPAWQQSWPVTRFVTNAVEVTFDAGYGAAAEVPQPIKQAMLLLIGHWYEHRGAVVAGVSMAEVPMAVDSLLWPYRVVTF